VLDVHAPSSRLVVEAFGKPGVRDRLLLIAGWSTASAANAEDLVSEALARALDPDDAPWVPGKYTFLTHMTFVIRQTWAQSLRKASAQRELLDGGIAQDETTASPEPRADDELDRRRELARRKALLDEVVIALETEYPLVRAISELGARGIEEPAAQAKELARSVDEVYRAHETLNRHARRALADWDRSEERRMASVRAQAVPGRKEVGS
jgi:hypothetical protein